MPSRPIKIILSVVGLVLVLIAIAVGSAIYLFVSTAKQLTNALNDDTTASVLQTTSNGKVAFALKYGKDVVSLTSLGVADDQGKELWKLDCRDSRKTPLVVYGELPSGAPKDYAQLIPAGGTTPSDIRGTRVRVKIVVRYVIAMGAGQQTYESNFDIARGP